MTTRPLLYYCCCVLLKSSTSRSSLPAFVRSMVLELAMRNKVTSKTERLIQRCIVSPSSDLLRNDLLAIEGNTNVHQTKIVHELNLKTSYDPSMSAGCFVPQTTIFGIYERRYLKHP